MNQTLKDRARILSDELAVKGIDMEWVKSQLKAQAIETPSWGYGNSGTRFKVFPWPGAARCAEERLHDAGIVHRLTKIAPSVALHIPWDKTDDWLALAEVAGVNGVRIGAINPNLFQDEDYKLGSVCHPSPEVRERATDHLLECCAIMEATGSSELSIWLADGTNYAGQDSIRGRKSRMLDCLRVAYAALPSASRMLLEYKFYEPAFYHTDIADWGTSFALCLALGEKAQVLVDTGHHALATNIPYIVAQLLDEGRLGGFHFNSRNYGDDDLIVGAANPFELFQIFHELVSAGDLANGVAYMIDQSHNIEPKLEAMIQSVLNCQSALAKALIVDRKKLGELQETGDVLGSYRVLVDAFETDIRPLLAEVREEMEAPLDPVAELRASGIEKKLAEERVGTLGSGWA
jgi:L-rhamnose isomerase / sugar isomerase